MSRIRPRAGLTGFPTSAGCQARTKVCGDGNCLTQVHLLVVIFVRRVSAHQGFSLLVGRGYDAVGGSRHQEHGCETWIYRSDCFRHSMDSLSHSCRPAANTFQSYDTFSCTASVSTSSLAGITFLAARILQRP